MIPFVVAAAVAAPLPAYIDETVARWGDKIEVTVEAKKCGQDNAVYDTVEDKVTLCSDLFDRPALTRAILNHELAHAYFDQHNLPLGEFAADELSFFMDEDDEVIAVENEFLDIAAAELADPTDDHPAALDRAAMFICLDDGYRGEGSAECKVYVRSAQEKWSLLLNP